MVYLTLPTHRQAKDIVAGYQYISLVPQTHKDFATLYIFMVNIEYANLYTLIRCYCDTKTEKTERQNKPQSKQATESPEIFHYLLSLDQRCRKPVETFVQTISSGRATGLDVPLAV